MFGDGEWFLYVNYFGVCECYIDDIFFWYLWEWVVIDNVYVFFFELCDCLVIIYLFCKFVGVFDGGYFVLWVYVFVF